jgi:hypothetical protein
MPCLQKKLGIPKEKMKYIDVTFSTAIFMISLLNLTKIFHKYYRNKLKICCVFCYFVAKM